MRQRLAYEIEDIKQLGYPRVVKMTFELSYLDWCRFEKSELFHSLNPDSAERESRLIGTDRYVR